MQVFHQDLSEFEQDHSVRVTSRHNGPPARVMSALPNSGHSSVQVERRNFPIT